MHQPRHRVLRRPQLVVAALVALVIPPVALLPLTVLSADSAAAAPAAGYTASFIPTGQIGYAAAVNPHTSRAYIADLSANTLSVIDGSTNSVTATIPLGGRPHGVAVDPATDTVYVSLAPTAATSALAVINGATNTVTDTITLTGFDPIGVAVDNATDVVYVTEYGTSAVTVIDGSTNTVTATVSTGSGTHPRDVAVDPATDVAWVADWSGNVFAISGASNTVTRTVSFSGANVAGVDVDPGTDTVYAAVESTPAVAVINGSTGTVSHSISVSEPCYSVGVDPGSGTVFASSFDGTSGSGTTWIIDASSNAIVDTVERGGEQIAVNTTTGAAYVAAGSAQTNGDWVLTPSAANAMSPVITSTLGTLTAGTAGTIVVEGTAIPLATYREAGALPAGVTVSPSGVLSGTPAPGTGGVYPITLTASNGIAPDYSETFTLTIDEAPAITSADQASFQAGVPSPQFTVTATGWPLPSFSETGPLPPGISFDSAGIFFGTPAAGTAGRYPMQIKATNSLGTVTQAFTLNIESGSSFVALAPSRVLDTRDGTGGYSRPVGAGQTIRVQVTGSNGVPGVNVTAVVLNVTAVAPTQASYVTVYPADGLRPTASNLNFTGGQTIANLVTVPVGGDGGVDFYNNTGSVNLVADVAGYYILAGLGTSYVPAGPSRVLDTRDGTGHSGAVGPDSAISLQITGSNGIPDTGVTAVALNVTAANPTASSYVTVYPDGQPRPTASNLNFTVGETIPNLVIVPVGSGGKVDLYNFAGSVSLIADVAGYYTTDGTIGSSFVPVGPSRVLDTRNGTGHAGAVGTNSVISLQVSGSDGIPVTGVTAVVLNVTAVNPTSAGYVTVYPAGITRPLASSLNFTAGETIPNLVVVPVGAGGMVDFYNFAGSVNLVADLAGYYISP